jgi:cell pole-organizing protein PopZ
MKAWPLRDVKKPQEPRDKLANLVNNSRIMGDIRHEPSMEDILASIKRIIAEDGASAVSSAVQRPRPRIVPDPEPEPAPPAPEEVLELTDQIEPETKETPLVSGDAAEASRISLARLSALTIRADPGSENTLDGLVRDLLKPLLKEWLDANLPELVETLVAREIARITSAKL